MKNKMKKFIYGFIVFLFLILGSFVFFAKKTDEVLSSFVFAGHIYGDPVLQLEHPKSQEENRYTGVYPPLLSAFEKLQEMDVSFFVFGGDSIYIAAEKSWDILLDQLSFLDSEKFFVLGNHENANRELALKYGTSFKTFEKDGSLFVILDSELDSGRISSDQIEKLEMVLSSDYQNVFIFFHKVLWRDATHFSTLRPNSLAGYQETSNFWSEVVPLFEDRNENVFFMAGDVGIKKTSTFSHEQSGKLHFITSGVGRGDGENFLLFRLHESGSVSLDVQDLIDNEIIDSFIFDPVSTDDFSEVVEKKDPHQNSLKAYATTYYREDGFYVKVKIRSRYERQLEGQKRFYESDDNRNFLFKNIEVSLNDKVGKDLENLSAYIDPECDMSNDQEKSLAKLNIKSKKKGVSIIADIEGAIPVVNGWNYDEKLLCFFVQGRPFSRENIKAIDFDIRALGRDEEKLIVNNSLVDLETFHSFDEISQSKVEFLEKNSIFNPLDGNRVGLLGKHEITKTIIVPNTIELVIDSGTELVMREGISFVSYGKVSAKGTSELPITVKAKDPQKPFGVFALANEGAAGSRFKNFHIEHGSETRINGIYFSGMFSAYHNDDILIEDSYFGYSHSDDGLNFKYSNSKVLNSTFEKNSADAIDFDFMGGEIRGNKFVENGNDSIDTSGSTTLIRDNYIYKSGDKCMSFGENSKTVVINNILDGCFIGVECKDLTTSVFINNAIINNKTAVNSYQKKDFFGPAHCTFHNSIFVGNERGIVFENNFKEGEKMITDTSTVIIKNSILPYKEFNGSDNFIESLSASDLSDARPASVEILKEFLPEYDENSLKIGIFQLDRIPQIK